jgi:hypothetical protein
VVLAYVARQRRERGDDRLEAIAADDSAAAPPSTIDLH